MLIELAIGDAYGAGFEYCDSDFIAENHNLTHYIQHPRHKGIWPGRYTDDTQMTIAIVEHMLSGDEWSDQNLASRFVDVFQRDPREGYAARFQSFLQSVSSGDAFLEQIKADSDKSGAAMRSGPIGLYKDIEQVLELSARQARITHDTELGTTSAQAAALITHYFCYSLGSKAEAS
jgi:ADP-ribosylglycohydrolase